MMARRPLLKARSTASGRRFQKMGPQPNYETGTNASTAFYRERTTSIHSRAMQNALCDELLRREPHIKRSPHPKAQPPLLLLLNNIPRTTFDFPLKQVATAPSHKVLHRSHIWTLDQLVETEQQLPLFDAVEDGVQARRIHRGSVASALSTKSTCSGDRGRRGGPTSRELAHDGHTSLRPWKPRCVRATQCSSCSSDGERSQVARPGRSGGTGSCDRF